MKTSYFVVLVAVGGLVGYWGPPTAAHATEVFRQHAAFFCKHGSLASPSGAGLSTGQYEETFYCPYMDDSLFARYAVDNVYVDVTDGDTSYSVTAAACVMYVGYNGYACGSDATTGASYTGTTLLNVTDLDEWSYSSYDWAYLKITIPGYSILRGYYVNEEL